jgi:hypothetical protein
VYFPADTPSNFSSSTWSTHCALCQSRRPEQEGRGKEGAGLEKVCIATNLAGEVELDGFDANVGGTDGHVCDLGVQDCVWEKKYKGLKSGEGLHRKLSM